MRALVTGVAGFIGSHLAEHLLDAGHTVIGVDCFTDYYGEGLKRANLRASVDHPNFSFVETDLAKNLPDGLFDGIDSAFHLAGQPGVRSSWGDNFREYTSNNVDATQRLLEAARSSDIQRFVYSSSSSVYGNADVFPTQVSALPKPKSPYGVTKLAAEHLCGVYASNFSVPTVSLRYFTVFGPRQRPDMAFTRFFRAILAEQPVPLYGNGTQIRDFSYVEDVVRANVLAATSDVQPGSVYNVAGGSSVSMNDVIGCMRDITGQQVEIDYSGVVDGDVFRTGGDTTSTAEDLGWAPQIPLEEGLDRQWQWVLASDSQTD
ncbi:NAD-dependent epimerase/dehydratase family protein [Terrabacter lapilli]|uniref:NAD-dependent epimerase/dehydratase family protein n=1 Tax=Terrabacter lapilli TaxID=436231 RepID=A0ABN2RAL5_9MICO